LNDLFQIQASFILCCWKWRHILGCSSNSCKWMEAAWGDWRLWWCGCRSCVCIRIMTSEEWIASALDLIEWSLC